MPKYHIEYAIEFGNRMEKQHYQTDDPVAAEEFLSALLERSLKVLAIRHEGVDLTPLEFDHMIKTAAEAFVARHISKSLCLDYDQVHYRFGYAA